MTDLAAEAAAGWRGGAQLRRLIRLLRVLLHLFKGLLLALWHGAWRDPYRLALRAIVRRWQRDLLRILGVQVDIQGPLPETPVMLVANHVSWLDIPVIGKLAQAAGTLFIRRGSGDGRARSDEIAGHLLAGRSILVFPEGTTTDGQTVRRFHSRLLGAAARAGVPVQPLALRYTVGGRVDTDMAFVGDDDFHHHLWRVLLRRRIDVRVIFTRVLPAEAQAPETLSQSAREQVLTALH